MSADIIQAIEAIDARRCQATIAKDRAVMDEILADDMVYVHSSAVAERRAANATAVCTAARAAG